MMRNPRAIRGQGSCIIVKATLSTTTAHTTRVITICRASGKSNGDDDAIARLQQENLLLREALAQYQGCNPSEVTIEIDKEEPSTPLPKSTQKQPRSTRAKKPNAAAISSGINWPSPSEDRFWERDAHSSPTPLPPSSSNTQSPDQDPSPLHIMHISAEMAPVAKVGGLGDVVPGLAKACLDMGHQVEIVLPFYQCIPDSAIQDLQYVLEIQVPKGHFQDGVMHGGSLKTHFFKGVIDGCPVILVRPDWEQSNLFKGDRIYGGSYNEAEAYLFFSRAALEYIKVSGSQPNVVHCHEWQTSAVPMLFWENVVVNMPSTRLILTIHNFDSPGECRQDEFAATGVGGDLFNTIDKALDERTIGHNPERLCLLKGGIVYSNAVTTVSPNYCNETLMGGAAGWLKSTLARPDVAAKYFGVLNGIDTGSWDPATDPTLPANFSPEDPEGKALCKKYLQMGLGLEVNPDKPLVAVISRLVPQKGIHLIEHAAHTIVGEKGGQFVVLGSGHAEGGLRGLANNNPNFGKNNYSAHFMYSEKLSRLIYAAADMFLVPSMFEPCGLTQMIALRYGCIPIVRKTGGLADTVHDVMEDSRGGNGFVFDGIDGGSLDVSLTAAFDLYKEKKQWDSLRRRVMAESGRWSWGEASTEYLKIYRDCLAK